MPGRLFLSHSVEDVGLAMSSSDVPHLVTGQNLSPGMTLGGLTTDGWVLMRWGLMPSGRTNARGRPVMENLVNIRSETAFTKSAFDGLQRALVPASGWYEWTGQTRRKSVWQIARRDGEPVVFAALTHTWNGPGGVQVPQVAILTCDPSPDVAVYHNRMGVALGLEAQAGWLAGADPASGLRVPKAGQFKVTRCVYPGSAR
ncbi:MAG: SOS response-associated peptidase family protein [Pseudomonadota bacterium]